MKEVEEEEGYRIEREEAGAIKLRGSRSQRRARGKERAQEDKN